MGRELHRAPARHKPARTTLTLRPGASAPQISSPRNLAASRPGQKQEAGAQPGQVAAKRDQPCRRESDISGAAINRRARRESARSGMNISMASIDIIPQEHFSPATTAATDNGRCGGIQTSGVAATGHLESASCHRWWAYRMWVPNGHLSQAERRTGAPWFREIQRLEGGSAWRQKLRQHEELQSARAQAGDWSRRNAQN